MMTTRRRCRLETTTCISTSRAIGRSSSSPPPSRTAPDATLPLERPPRHQLPPPPAERLSCPGGSEVERRPPWLRAADPRRVGDVGPELVMVLSASGSPSCPLAAAAAARAGGRAAGLNRERAAAAGGACDTGTDDGPPGEEPRESKSSSSVASASAHSAITRASPSEKSSRPASAGACERPALRNRMKSPRRAAERVSTSTTVDAERSGRIAISASAATCSGGSTKPMPAADITRAAWAALAGRRAIGAKPP